MAGATPLTRPRRSCKPRSPGHTGGAGGSLADISSGYGTGGTGGDGYGGHGGTNSVSAGTFNLSNSISGAGQSAAGVLVLGQNSGPSSLVQPSVTVQANLAVH